MQFGIQTSYPPYNGTAHTEAIKLNFSIRITWPALFYVTLKGEHWCKTIFYIVKGQPKINQFTQQIFKKSFYFGTFRPPKVGKNMIWYSLLLLYLAGRNTLFLLQPAGGNSFLLLYPAGGNSLLLLYPAGGNRLVLLLLAGRKQTNA